MRQTRLTSQGTRLYDRNSIGGRRVISIHNHANNIRTVGMGEFVATMNGVEFRTRHNDYRMSKPGSTREYRATEDIDYPDVPPEVLSQPTIADQITEMRAWFKAWKDQDFSVRDYRKYFKPVVVYVEGAWTRSSESIEEPFSSDRHFIDASSWYDLIEKVRFTSYTGGKSTGENFAYLPTTIMNITNGVPDIAQWNYRILAAPISFDIGIDNFRVVDDIASRASFKSTLPNHGNSRAARFQLDPMATGWSQGESKSKYGLLDQIMEEVPGMDNYGANLTDQIYSEIAEHVNDGHLNAAYYHRVYKMNKKDAMGEKERFRGFNDASLFFAMNTQEKIAAVEYCKGWKCEPVQQRWSYALPLEIIYLTPLYKWNPYNLLYKGEHNSVDGKTVTADGRNGGMTQSTAYDGTNSKVFYQTPADFFGGSESSGDSADTAKGVAGVLDQSGVVQAVRASGTRIELPYIEGVGSLRTRFPIAAFVSDGDTVMKQVEAVKDMVSEQRNYLELYRIPPVESSYAVEGDLVPDVEFVMGGSSKDGVFPHTHSFKLHNSTVAELVETLIPIIVFTNEEEGHNHKLLIKYVPNRAVPFRIEACDDKGAGCSHSHGSYLYPQGGVW